MEIFKGQNLLEFAEHFKTDLDCKAYLGQIKWKEGYVCRKCDNTSHQVRKNFSRTCNKCGDTESPSANTIFHRVRFGLRKAYNITQVDSNKALNFKALHTMIHQIKSWIRTTYSWVSEFNLNRYFNAFCFRINRSQSKIQYSIT